ncbi:MAG: Ni/Fe-hydrogenase cytochrome b subunit [Elusimicrobia bacterium]|nr:Ni/Fe-hydrogenase cytochrome b subunit [Elusimicrobiota bacterium]
MMVETAGWSVLILCSGIFLWGAWAAAVDRRPPFLAPALTGALSLLWSVAAVVLTVRFINGLGATTAMTDRFPWGVWIGLIQAGVAVSSGGYVVAATVHIFHIRRFEPVLRPMVLTAFLGYCFVAASLFIEVGRPYRLWHPIAMWQHHSIMFEVAWCVTLYMTVLALEFAPVVLERFRMHTAIRVMHIILMPLVIAGVILSTLHQSSLGSMFLIVPQKIHPLWSSPLLPVIYLISSVAVGLAMTMIASFFSSKAFGRALDASLLKSLASAAGLVLGLYFLVRAVDFTARGAWTSVLSPAWLGAFFALEMGAGVLWPALLFATAKSLDDPRRLVAGSFGVVFGVTLNRLCVSWFGMVPHTGPVYFPSSMELIISLALVAAAVAAFALAARFLPVFPAQDEGHARPEQAPRHAPLAPPSSLRSAKGPAPQVPAPEEA